ncbi:MAG: hypothetical protein J5978_07410 [Spirochaetaceae bacterium]|nr:hypothetical protein [Spirochaetaceae bacterium]
MKKIGQLLLALFLMLITFIGCQNPAGGNNPPKTEDTDAIVLDASQSNASAVFKTAIGAYPTDNKQVKTVTYTFKANQENIDIYPYIKTGDVVDGNVDWNNAQYNKFGNYSREDKNTKTTWQTVTVDIAKAVANTAENTDYKVLFDNDKFDYTKSLVQVGFELYKDAGSAIDELTVEVKDFVVTYADDTTFELKKDNVQVETGWGGDSSLTAT